MVNKLVIASILLLVLGLFVFSGDLFAIITPYTNNLGTLVMKQDLSGSHMVTGSLIIDSGSKSLNNVKLSYEVYGPNADSITYAQPISSGVILQGNIVSDEINFNVNLNPSSWVKGVDVNGGVHDIVSDDNYHLLIILTDSNGDLIPFEYTAGDNINNPNNLNGGGVAWRFSVHECDSSNDCLNDYSCDVNTHNCVKSAPVEYKGRVIVSW